MAEQTDCLRELQALTAGVPDATDEGVICGVGRGPIRTSPGVGGKRLGLGSRNVGGAIMDGVGVISWDIVSS